MPGRREVDPKPERGGLSRNRVHFRLSRSRAGHGPDTLVPAVLEAAVSNPLPPPVFQVPAHGASQAFVQIAPSELPAHAAGIEDSNRARKPMLW